MLEALDGRPILAVALVTCLLVAGCAGGSGASDDGAPAEGAAAAETMTTASGGGAAPGDEAAASRQAEAGNGNGNGGDGGSSSSASKGDASAPAASTPALIRTGKLTIRADDYDAARAAVARAARSSGGYVAESGEQLHREGNRSWESGYVVVRVPAEDFPTMLAAAKAEGTVLNEETSTRDVADKLVDLEARLENLRAKRERLRSFYDRANTTQELLRVEERLSKVQGRIERLKAKKRALEGKVAYSTLRVRIVEPEPAPETTTVRTTTTPTPYHERSVTDAFSRSLSSLVVLVRATFVTLAYAAPYLLVASLPAAGLVVAWRRRDQLLGRDRDPGRGPEPGSGPDDDENRGR